MPMAHKSAAAVAVLLLLALTETSPMSQANAPTPSAQSHSNAAAPAASAPAPASSAAPKTPGALPSDAEGFAFLAGRWKVQHRKLQNPWATPEVWKDFKGTARFHTILDGLGSVEELINDKGKPFGGALRMFDREKRVWTDSWIPYSTGLVSAPVEGRFVGKVGTFDAEDTGDDGQPITVRGVWTRITPRVVTWQQLFSRDKGQTWLLVWHMRFEKTR
jgi:hypothetical protein